MIMRKEKSKKSETERFIEIFERDMPPVMIEGQELYELQTLILKGKFGVIVYTRGTVENIAKKGEPINVKINLHWGTTAHYAHFISNNWRADPEEENVKGISEELIPNLTGDTTVAKNQHVEAVVNLIYLMMNGTLKPSK